MALGCDAVAHSTCIDNNGKTIAVLPSTIDKIYPSENKEIAEKIVENGGLLVSEYHKNPISKHEAISRFIERDRLQAMFSKTIILISSYRKGEGDSGSRHAMEAAKKYGIDRFVMFNKATDDYNIKFGHDSSKENPDHEIISQRFKRWFNCNKLPSLSIRLIAFILFNFLMVIKCNMIF